MSQVHAAPALTPFSQLMTAMQDEGAAHSISLPADWLQGRTAYVGVWRAALNPAPLKLHPK
jgi:hypothetical protein